MLQSHSIQDYVGASEDGDLMLLSAWLLACALLLEGNYQQLRQQDQKGRVKYAT